MPSQLFSNNASSTVTVALSAGATSLTIDAADQAEFASPTAGDWQLVTITEGTTIEIVKVTARTTNVLTIVRAQEGTTDSTFTTAATVSANNTKGTMEALQSVSSGNGSATLTTSNPASGEIFWDIATTKTVVAKETGVTVSLHIAPSLTPTSTNSFVGEFILFTDGGNNTFDIYFDYEVPAESVSLFYVDNNAPFTSLGSIFAGSHSVVSIPPNGGGPGDFSIYKVAYVATPLNSGTAVRSCVVTQIGDGTTTVV